jgi:hypothetical protein
VSHRGRELLNRCTVKSCTGGSNPPLSASHFNFPHFWLLIQASLRAASVAFLFLCSGPSSGQLQVIYARPSSNQVMLNACGSTIEVRFDGETESVSRENLQKWVNRAATAVCTFYDRFPVPHLSLVIHARGSSGIHHGVTYPSDGGFITISVGPQTKVAELDDDWMMTHEMIHLAFPSMAENHHWIEEGISVYVEPIARVQAGQLSVAKMWSDVIRDMPKGEPATDDQGLDRTHTWGRTYWGGALFCLVADVQIRDAPTIARAYRTPCAVYSRQVEQLPRNGTSSARSLLGTKRPEPRFYTICTAKCATSLMLSICRLCGRN